MVREMWLCPTQWKLPRCWRIYQLCFSPLLVNIELIIYIIKSWSKDTFSPGAYNLYFSTFGEKLFPLTIILFLLWLLILFIALAVSADDYFCPSIEIISKVLRWGIQNINLTQDSGTYKMMQQFAFENNFSSLINLSFDNWLTDIDLIIEIW